MRCMANKGTGLAPTVNAKMSCTWILGCEGFSATPKLAEYVSKLTFRVGNNLVTLAFYNLI